MSYLVTFHLKLKSDNEIMWHILPGMVITADHFGPQAPVPFCRLNVGNQMSFNITTSQFYSVECSIVSTKELPFNLNRTKQKLVILVLIQDASSECPD